MMCVCVCVHTYERCSKMPTVYYQDPELAAMHQCIECVLSNISFMPMLKYNTHHLCSHPLLVSTNIQQVSMGTIFFFCMEKFSVCTEYSLYTFSCWTPLCQTTTSSKLEPLLLCCQHPPLTSWSNIIKLGDITFRVTSMYTRTHM